MNIDIYNLSENSEIECKEAKGGLPKDLWETYSAFANSNGGVILLGIKEKSGAFYITGVDDFEKIIKDLWDNLNNPKKVSANLLTDSNVVLETYDDKNIIKITVPRADRKQKPVYIGENPYNESKHSGTFRRNYSGDYKCSKLEIDRMIADAGEDSQDGLIIEGFDIDDLNIDTISSFRNRLASLKPSHPWLSLDLKPFLYKLGAYGKDRKRGVEGITAGGLLMFGEERAIIDEFPKYFLDYREKFSEDRWDYRVTSSEGTWSGNLYDFYFKIINKITDSLNVPFRLVNGVRQDDTRVHTAIREAVANTIIHADYRLPRGIVIERGKTYFKFSNPGSLRISIEEALNGGISDPRNENIFKMFSLIGVGERAGSGLENIRLAWKEQEWTLPDLEENYDPDRVDLTLRTISLIPQESIVFLKSVLKEEHENLVKEEVMALVTAHQEDYVTNNRLQSLIDTHSLYSNKILSSLVEKGYLESKGIGRGTKYYLSETFIDNKDLNQDTGNEENEDNANTNEFGDLNHDEAKVIQYIIDNGYITNSLSRAHLGFGKTKSISLFNKLIDKDKIEKTGSGFSTKYILKLDNYELNAKKI
jgi:ATP-dependent DNA helicase RecG